MQNMSGSNSAASSSNDTATLPMSPNSSDSSLPLITPISLSSNFPLVISSSSSSSVPLVSSSSSSSDFPFASPNSLTSRLMNPSWSNSSFSFSSPSSSSSSSAFRSPNSSKSKKEMPFSRSSLDQSSSLRSSATTSSKKRRLHSESKKTLSSLSDKELQEAADTLITAEPTSLEVQAAYQKTQKGDYSGIANILSMQGHELHGMATLKAEDDSASLIRALDQAKAEDHLRKKEYLQAVKSCLKILNNQVDAKALHTLLNVVTTLDKESDKENIYLILLELMRYTANMHVNEDDLRLDDTSQKLGEYIARIKEQIKIIREILRAKVSTRSKGIQSVQQAQLTRELSSNSSSVPLPRLQIPEAKEELTKSQLQKSTLSPLPHSSSLSVQGIFPHKKSNEEIKATADNPFKMPQTRFEVLGEKFEAYFEQQDLGIVVSIGEQLVGNGADQPKIFGRIIELCERILTAHPGNISALMHYMRAFVSFGRIDDALDKINQLFQKINNLHPTIQAQYHFQRGFLYAIKWKNSQKQDAVSFDNSLEDFKSAKRLDWDLSMPADSFIHSMIAEPETSASPFLSSFLSPSSSVSSSSSSSSTQFKFE